MGTKHRLGPWHEREAGDFIDVIAANGDRIARVCEHGPQSETPDAQQANARLIAAAPQLYAIASSVAKLQLHQMPDRQPCNCTGCELVREAQAVVSKVTEE